MYTNDERFAILHTPGSNTWTLQIKFVQRRDHGMYECQVRSIFAYLLLYLIIETMYKRIIRCFLPSTTIFLLNLHRTVWRRHISTILFFSLYFSYLTNDFTDVLKAACRLLDTINMAFDYNNNGYNNYNYLKCATFPGTNISIGIIVSRFLSHSVLFTAFSLALLCISVSFFLYLYRFPHRQELYRISLICKLLFLRHSFWVLVNCMLIWDQQLI